MPHLAQPRRACAVLFALCLVAALAASARAQTKVNGRIAFSRGGCCNSEIYVMLPDGTRDAPLTAEQYVDKEPAWSADGRKIAYVNELQNTLVVMNADGSGKKNLTRASWLVEPSWSPDGKKIAISSNKVGGFDADIHVVNADGTGVVRITNDPTSLDSDPVWSPDGTRVAFVRRDGYSYRQDIYVVNADGTGLVNLTKTGAADVEWWPAWSPDGQRIAYVLAGRGIWTMNADGTGRVPLGVEGREPAWSPDGRKIVFADTPLGETDSEIFVVNADGSGRKQLTDTNENESGPAWQPLTARVLISEFRTRGVGPIDEFVELYNGLDIPLTVASTDGSAGWALTSLSNSNTAVVYKVIPNGTVIPARGHLLVAPASTPLGYSHGGLAVPDLISTRDLTDNTGVALFATSNPANFKLNRRLDAVGFRGPTGASADLHREGAGLAPGPTDDIFIFKHSFVRKFSAAGLPQDTNNNAADFVLISTDARVFDGTPSVLGTPGPENARSPVERGAGLQVTLIDPAQPPTAAPNRVRSFTPAWYGPLGTLSIRRRVTNNTGAPVTRLRFRVSAITTLGSPNTTGGVQADLRVLDSFDLPVQLTGGGTTTVRATTLEGTVSEPHGGGLNSSLNTDFVTPDAPLAPGASVDVQFLLRIERSGNYRFYVVIEALP